MIHGRLFLLGSIRLTVGPGFHGTPLDLRSEETAQLLAYLALNRDRSVHRQQLAFRLWPDCDEAGARRHLRQHLHRLRLLLQNADLPADTIESHAQQLRFNLDAGLWVDVHAFRRMAADRSSHIEALEIYGGDLLADQNQPWIETDRLRLRDTYLRLLRTQIDGAKMARNYPRAVHYARRLVRATPLRESSHRIYMEALYLDGQRAAAVRQYEQLRELLARELDVAPMAETKRLAEQIRAGELPRDVPIVGPGAREMATLREFTEMTDRLVGRRDEVAALDNALARAQAGRGSFILLQGAPGRGKSYLLDTWLAGRHGQMTCLRADGCPPTLLSVLNAGAIDWSLFPTAYSGVDALRAAATAGAPDDTARPDRLGDILLTIAARSGRAVVLALDDLARATDATWDALAFVARRCATQPLLLLGAADPARHSDHARRLWRSLRSERHVTVLPLGAMSPDDCAAMAEQQLHAPLTPALRNALYRETEGHPGHVAAFCREAGTVSNLAASLTRVPPVVVEQVAARMAALPAGCREVIRHAAKTGRSFTYEEISRAAPADPEQLLTCLEVAVDQGLLAEFGDGYTFPHRLTRRVVGDDRRPLTADRRRDRGEGERAV